MRRWNVQRVMMFSFLVGLLLSLFPLPLSLRQWWPEWLLIMVIFWAINQPQLFSVGAAFIFGLVVDAITGSILAMHAIPYALCVYLTRFWGQNFPLWTLIEQSMFVIFLLVIATLSHLFLLFFSPFMVVSSVVYLQILFSSFSAWFLLHLSLSKWHRQL